jgi:hypothetical protein
LGALGTPASLPSWVVTIFESSLWRSSADGWAISRPAAAAAASVSSSNMTKTALPPEPARSTRSSTSLCPSR